MMPFLEEEVGVLVMGVKEVIDDVGGETSKKKREEKKEKKRTRLITGTTTRGGKQNNRNPQKVSKQFGDHNSLMVVWQLMGRPVEKNVEEEIPHPVPTNLSP